MRIPYRLMATIAAMLAMLTLRQAIALVASPSSAEPELPAPEWTKDLVIYEIATKAFTSPQGPETGTFSSLTARLPYLKDLGITGIWLTGHSSSDAHHFYNIWTQYAVIEPDKIDPTLGTPAAFKDLIDAAHAYGIKVFLDVITHGVMRSSPLIAEHPQWFRGGSYGMTDYDWQGGHHDLDEWWVQIWTDAVTKYGVDGFRLDVNIFRPDLWERIRRNAAAARHPVVIFIEGQPVIPGVTDFTQKSTSLSSQIKDVLRGPAIDNVPKLYAQRFSEHVDNYRLDAIFTDGTKTIGSTLGNERIKMHVLGYTSDRITDAQQRQPGQAELHIALEGVPEMPIESLSVSPLDSPANMKREWVYGQEGGFSLDIEGRAPSMQMYLSSFYGYSSSVQLSSHDNGWEGFPADKNPYAAEGSRSVFGYSFLFTPMIPLFMAGEEFDADFHALPGLSPDLYGGANPGKGKWLYGAQLDWSELEQSRHREMLADVKKMLAIRKIQHAILTTEVRGDVQPALVAVPFESDITVPAPYMRWHGSAGIIVLANRNTEQDAKVKLNVPLEYLGSIAGAKYRVTDLWATGKTRLYSSTRLRRFSVPVKRDKTARGGLAIYKVERLSLDHK